jgi:hypothetical protein
MYKVARPLFTKRRFRETWALMAPPANAKLLLEAVRGFEAGDAAAVPFP